MLPESLHTAPATSISQKLDEPKAVHTVRVRPEAPPAPPAITVAPTPSPPPTRVAAAAAVEPVDVDSRPCLTGIGVIRSLPLITGIVPRLTCSKQLKKGKFVTGITRPTDLAR